LVLNDLDIAARARLLDAEKHRAPKLRHHETRIVLNNKAENNVKRGTTFCKNTKPTPSKSMAYQPKSNFTVQVGLDWWSSKAMAAGELRSEQLVLRTASPSSDSSDTTLMGHIR